MCIRDRERTKLQGYRMSLQNVNISVGLEDIVNLLAEMGNIPTETLHKIVFCSILKAGLSLYSARMQHLSELNNLLRSIPLSYRGLVTGRLYLKALKLVKDFEKIIKDRRRAPLLKEANLQHIQGFLKRNLGKVDKVAVLDCASVPEIATFAAKFKSLNRHPTILAEIFINPLGATRFLTQQLKMFNQKTALSGYAQLLKQTLNAKQCYKTPIIDLTVHKNGVSISRFLNSLNVQAIFEKIKDLTGLDSILITHDHGYDIAADNHGLYVIHGYKGECPINFSKMALFLETS